MRQKSYYVYILTNKLHSVLYIGVTNDLKRRIFEHRNKLVSGFTVRYNLNRLIYFEQTDDVLSAIGREKQLKRWSRLKKEWLIGLTNPRWNDLTEEIQFEDLSRCVIGTGRRARDDNNEIGFESKKPAESPDFCQGSIRGRVEVRKSFLLAVAGIVTGDLTVRR